LSGAHLSGADLRAADLRAHLESADLTGANLESADLTGADHLTQAQLHSACGKPRALPEGLMLDKPCSAPSLNQKTTP
jgi:uncharacterized protein YjbI with pentapeptide repeats